MSFNFTKSLLSPSCFSIHNVLISRGFAARKGTRERKEKKKAKKVEEVKIGFIPHNIRHREAMLAARPKLKFDDSWKRLPVDNVYNMKYYQSKIYPFQEAVQCHREINDPTMYNTPGANLQVRIELNMQGEKKTRFVDNFNKVVAIPHPFPHGEDRTVIAFSKSIEVQKEALSAGAVLAGGLDLIKQIQNGAVSLHNFQYVISHPDILPELVALRGLMKRNFPNPKQGTLDLDLAKVTQRFLYGINYVAKKDEHEKDFGLIETILGTIDMDSKHLEDNFGALIRDINTMKPKRPGTFISRCLLISPPSIEKFKVDHNLYIEEDSGKSTGVESEEETGERVAL